MSERLASGIEPADRKEERTSDTWSSGRDQGGNDGSEERLKNTENEATQYWKKKNKFDTNHTDKGARASRNRYHTSAEH